MAIFTKLNEDKIKDFILPYQIGNLEKYEEIIEGIENTNYKIFCNGTPYILTIFEKRVKEKDLPFFMSLKKYLNNNNFKCPKPIEDINGNCVNNIEDKKAALISFIDGKQINDPNINQCKEIGKVVGNLHNLTINFDKIRHNTLDLNEWKRIYEKCRHEDFSEIFENLENELKYLEKSWPKELPSGIIHADLFKDNIFFKKDIVSGVIDFYFSCYDYFIYDIAIIVNDWCFIKDDMLFNKLYFDKIIEGYNCERKLLDIELNSLNILLRAAAVRILVTRLHDYIFHPSDAIVIKKDPYEYFNILKWHQQNSIL